MNQGKLVRDKIPQIITAAGKKPITRILDHPEYLEELDKKLREQVSLAKEWCNALGRIL